MLSKWSEEAKCWKHVNVSWKEDHLIFQFTFTYLSLFLTVWLTLILNDFVPYFLCHPISQLKSISLCWHEILFPQMTAKPQNRKNKVKQQMMRPDRQQPRQYHINDVDSEVHTSTGHRTYSTYSTSDSWNYGYVAFHKCHIQFCKISN